MTFNQLFTETGNDSRAFRAGVGVEVNSGPQAITTAENIYVPAQPTADVADTIKFFVDERQPEEGDDALKENDDEKGSLVFYGKTGEWCMPTRIRFTAFSGLMANVDTLTAEVAIMEGDNAQVLYTDTYTETGANTNLFRLTSTAEPRPQVTRQYQWTVKVANRNGSDRGTYTPLATRLKGLPDDLATDYVIDLGGANLGLEKNDDDGYWYVKGNSRS
jgi:hypothetical protein